MTSRIVGFEVWYGGFIQFSEERNRECFTVVLYGNCILFSAHILTCKHMAACGSVDWALDWRSKGLEFDSHCLSFVEILGKLLILYCLCLPISDWYLMHTCVACVLYR